MVRLVQQTFVDRTPLEEFVWETIFLITVIGFVELEWKLCPEVLNCRLKRGGVLHDALHRFRG